MARYIITQDSPVWIRETYVVEAHSEEEAEDKFYQGDHEYVGHELRDSIPFLDNQLASVELEAESPVA